MASVKGRSTVPVPPRIAGTLICLGCLAGLALLVAWRAPGVRTLGGLVAAQGADADGSRWRFPEPIDPPPIPAAQQGVRLVVDASGGAHAVWTDGRSGADDRSVWYARRPADRNWEPAWRVARAGLDAGDGSGVSQDVADPDVAVDSDHRVHVVFVSHHGGIPHVMHAARSPTGGPFRIRGVVEHSGAPQIEPRIAADPWGQVHVVWTDFRGRDADVRHSTRVPDGRWIPSVRIHDDVAADQRDPALAFDRKGNLHAVWRDTRGRRSGIRAAHFPAGSRLDRGHAWWPEQALDRTAGGLQRDPAIAGDGTGRMVAVWIDEAAGSTLRLATRAAGADRWALDRIVYRPDRGRLLDAAVAAASGRALVAWSESRPGDARIYAAHVPDLDGPAEPALRLDRSRAFSDARRPSVALDRRGRASAAWDTASGAQRLAVDSVLALPRRRGEVITLSGRLQFVPRVHNCHRDAYQIILCNGTPDLLVVDEGLEMERYLGGYVEIDGTLVEEGPCRYVAPLAIRVKRTPCPRDTASITGILTAGGEPVAGATVHVGPVALETGFSGRYFGDGFPADTYPITATLPCALILDAGEVTVRPGQRLQMPTARFERVDVDGDCRVTLADLTILGARYRLEHSDRWPCADLDRDGVVGISDMARVSDALDMVCPTPWTAAVQEGRFGDRVIGPGEDER